MLIDYRTINSRQYKDLPETKESLFSCRFFLRVKSSEDNNYISVYLCNNQSPKYPFKADFRLMLVNQDNLNEREELLRTLTTPIENYGWGSKTFIQHCEIGRFINESDSTLKFVCYLKDLDS